jgi:hypothetical protein
MQVPAFSSQRRPTPQHTDPQRSDEPQSCAQVLVVASRHTCPTPQQADPHVVSLVKHRAQELEAGSWQARPGAQQTDPQASEPVAQAAQSPVVGSTISVAAHLPQVGPVQRSPFK